MAVEVPVVEPLRMAAATTTVEMAAVARGAGNQVTTIRGARGDDTTTIATITIGTTSNRVETSMVETGSIMTRSSVNFRVTTVVTSGRTAAATTEIRITTISTH